MSCGPTRPAWTGNAADEIGRARRTTVERSLLSIPASVQYAKPRAVERFFLFGAPMNLLSLLQKKIRAALTSMVADPEPYATMVKPTQDAKHGDYQANCAMSLAKALGKKPREVAEEIAARQPSDDVLQAPEIAGPGFINLRLQNAWVARQLQEMARSDRLGVEGVQPAQTVVVDFSSPNVAKPMHVGHLRSTIIGDAIARTLDFRGDRVIRQNHLGDWGTQFGMMLFGYKNYLNKSALEKSPIRELLRLYVLVRDISKPDDIEEEGSSDQGVKYTEEAKQIARIMAEACRKETAKLHADDVENLFLWKQFMPWCVEEIEPIYTRLGIQFDHTFGESFYNPMLPSVVEDLVNKDIAEQSQGAVAVFLDAEKHKSPALIQKRDGAFTYTTSDLATIRYRIDNWKPDVILYVVDARQSLHFQNLFEIARRWGFDRTALEHVSFGSVLGKDGKPIKTREGGAVELGALLDEAVERAGDVYEANLQEALGRGEVVEPLTEAERGQVHEVVGIGAVKYADLSQNRTSDYKFDFDKMLAMNGNTATYMQYAYVRNRGIFRKGNEDVARFRSAPPLPLLETPHERALAIHLLRLEETLLAAAADYQPSAITTYLWDLAKAYSGFFQNCPVIKAATAELRDSRLLLCDLTGRVIRLCLDLLGIRVVERM